MHLAGLCYKIDMHQRLSIRAYVNNRIVCMPSGMDGCKGFDAVIFVEYLLLHAAAKFALPAEAMSIVVLMPVGYSPIIHAAFGNPIYI